MAEKGMVFSHSRLETYESCALKFKYQYIDKVDIPKRDSIEAFLGSRVHEALEELYRHKLMGKLWAKEEFLQYYTNVWEKEKHDEIFIVKKQYSLQDYFQQGVEALTKYWERYYPFDSEKTIALEQRIYLSLDDGDRYRLQGFVDRISKTPEGVWQIRDYKTKRKLPTIDEAANDRQLALYQIGLQKMWENTDKVELIWHYLLFDEEVKSTREKPDLEKLKIDTIHTIQEVEAAIKNDEFPYRESALCDWCDFFDICPAKKHLAQVMPLPPKEFKEDEGVILADRYSELHNKRYELRKQIAAIEEEMEVVEEEIFRYAGQFDMTRIYGSSRSLNVKIEETFRLPTNSIKSERPQREQLESYLKNTGIWLDVSQLTPARLIKLYESSELEQKQRTELKRFMIPHMVKQVRAGSTKDYDENFEG